MHSGTATHQWCSMAMHCKPVEFCFPGKVLGGRAGGAQFVNERGPCYFSGTNICFSGCFPEHDQAEQVAADLARFGINLVHLHYVHHKFPSPER